jgi:aryl-alcohol dehydrogenase-like predicted oxidoreductase
MSISRRTFLESTALAGFASKALAATSVDSKTGMPMRVLGKTGVKVSLLGMGCGSRWLMHKEEEQGLAALNKLIDAGVNYIDSAQSYGNGESERRLGLFLKERRKNLFLVTKIAPRGYDEVMRTYEESLKRLQTDRVDLLHMHHLDGADDLAAIEAPNGALKALYKLRDEKAARFIGTTCHADPAVLKTCLERHDLDCVQIALNAGLMGAGKPSNVRNYSPSFESIALPVALRKNMGVTAMKVYAQDKLLPDGAPKDLTRYAMTLPVASAVIGMPKMQHIEENLGFAKSFTPMSKDEMKGLSRRLAAAKKAEIDGYFANHRDACDACGVQLA